MAKDDEFRKVAEDVRALARSLAKDFRDSMEQSRGSGHEASRALRQGMKGIADEARQSMREVADEARRNMYSGGRGNQGPRRHGRRYPNYPGWGPPVGGRYGPYPPAPPPSDDLTDPADQPDSVPPPGSGWGPPNRLVTRPTHPPRPAKVRPAKVRRGLPPVRRRWDATTVAGLLVVLFGVAWLLSAVHALNVSVEAVVAIGLMVLGASLVITGRTDWSLSRQSWPIWVGIGLVAVLLATSSAFGVSDAFSSISFGKMSRTAPANGGTVHGGFGQLKLDATRLGAGSTLQVDSVAGQTVIDVPKNDTVNVHARLGAGQICVGSKVSSGVDANYDGSIASSGSKPATITIDVHQVAGQIEIDPTKGKC